MVRDEWLMMAKAKRCPQCGSDLKLTKEQRGAVIRAAFEKAKSRGQKIGRPKERDDAEIKRLRSLGWAIKKISRELGISRWSVRAGLK